MRGYYFITDAHLSRAGSCSDVIQAMAAGVEVIQYRAKDLSSRAMFIEAKRLRQLCPKTCFLVNDRVDIALAVGADGVHLGQDDLPLKEARALLGPKKIIGVTAHNIEEAKAAADGGADYLGISPVFRTETKPDAGAPGGIGLLEQINQAVDIPLVAIGGITLENAPSVIRAGADCICAISAVLTHADVLQQIRRFQGLFETGAR